MSKNVALPFIFIGIYIIITMLISLIPLQKYKISSFIDYHKASKNMSFFFVSLCVLSSFYASSTWTGWFAYVIQNGLYGIYVVPYVSTFGALYYCLSSKIYNEDQKKEIHTLGGFLESKYQNTYLKYITAIIGILFTIAVIIIEIVTTGYIIYITTNGYISFEIGSLIGLLIIILYILWGGIESIVFTDAFQSLVMFIGGIIITIFFVKHFYGDINTLAEVFNSQAAILINNPQSLYSIENSRFIFISLVIISIFGVICWPQIFTRMYMGKSERVQKRTGIYISITALWCLCFIVCGLGGIFIIDKSIDVQSALLNTIFNSGNLIIYSVLCVFIIAASMGTLDTTLFSATIIITEDIIIPTFKDQRKIDLLKISRIIILFISIISYLLSLIVTKNIISIILPIYEILAQIFPLIFFASFMERRSSKGAISGLFAGIIFTLAFKLFSIDTIFLPGIIGLIINFSINYYFILKEHKKEKVFKDIITLFKSKYLIVFTLIFIISIIPFVVKKFEYIWYDAKFVIIWSSIWVIINTIALCLFYKLETKKVNLDTKN